MQAWANRVYIEQKLQKRGFSWSKLFVTSPAVFDTSWQVFQLEKKWQKNSCSTDNPTRCFMATALNSPTQMSLFTTGGITRFTWGTTFLW